MAKKKYQVFVPVHEYWIFLVEADSPEEAARIAESGQYEDGESVEQIGSCACGAGEEKTKVKS